jgi:hypothetical protein
VQKELERLRTQDQKDIKRLKQELRRKEKALAESPALLLALTRFSPSGERTATTDLARRLTEGFAYPR